MDQRNLLDKFEEIVYVTSIEDHQVYYINGAGLRFLGRTLEECVGRKCYEVIQGLGEVCSFCTNNILSREKFYVWEKVTNGRVFLLKDLLITWEGKDARLEIAYDASEAELLTRRTQEALQMRETLISCVQILSNSEQKLERRVQQVMAQVGEFYQADRAYLFNLDEERDVWNNTYEWCREDVQPVIDALQGVSYATVYPWVHEFETSGRVYIEDLEATRETQPDIYEVLEPQGIQSLLAAPLMEGEKVVAFIGVDNPSTRLQEYEFLASLVYFLNAEISKDQMLKEIRFMHGYDAMTGLLSRSSYSVTMQSMHTWSMDSLGYVMVDINNLKRVNDQEGQRAGDKLIQRVVFLLRKHFIIGSQIFRTGGDEFIILCPDMQEALFRQKVEQLAQDFRQPNGQVLASLGAVWEDMHIDLRGMDRQANKQMSQHKSEYYAWLRSAYHVSARQESVATSPFLREYFNFLLTDCDMILKVDLGADTVEAVHVREDNVYQIPEGADILSGSFDGIKRFCASSQDEDIFDQTFDAAVLDRLYRGEETIIDCKVHLVGQEDAIYWSVIRAQSWLESGADGTLHPCMTLSVENLQRSFRAISEAQRDSVTGLYSHTYFCRQLDYVLQKKGAKGGRLAVIRANIRSFRIIGDLGGAVEGDAVLRKVGGILKRSLGEGGMACRQYADAYYLFQCFEGEEEIERLLDKIQEEVSAIPGFPITMIYGACWVSAESAVDARRLCIQADYAHNQCRSSGMRIAYFDEEIRQQTLRDTRLIAELDEALQSGQFTPFLQPKVDSRSGAVVGAEALVRWFHPKFGSVSPGQFVPLFERNRTMHKVDWRVWREICQMLRRNLDDGLRVVPVSLNMSKVHLFERDFVQRFIQLVDSYRIPHRLLEMEITETMYTENRQLLDSVTQALRQTGFQVSIDDFGTGDSSLNMLWKTAVDVLKLDRGFFQALNTDRTSDIVVKHVVQMAQDMGMHLVAEGVETQPQVEYLKALGCYTIQGFYYYRPMPVAEFEDLLRKEVEAGDGGKI